MSKLMLALVPIAFAVMALGARTASPISRLDREAASSWTAPPALQDASKQAGVREFTLIAAPTRLEFVPGKSTEAWAYNGAVPGPTIELREGDRVTVHFHNKLSQPTTVHWHGLHLPAAHDGSPLHPVPPGGSRGYVFRIPLGSAGTYWYHPHPDMTTTEQVSKGLYGALIVRPAKDPLEGIQERLLSEKEVTFGRHFRPVQV